eukprot:1173204-Rhodomonas_salina.1
MRSGRGCAMITTLQRVALDNTNESGARERERRWRSEDASRRTRGREEERGRSVPAGRSVRATP